MAASEEEPPVVLTTEEEVKQLSVASTRNLYQLLITRPSKDFNRRRNFVDRDSHLGTEGLVEYRSFKDPNYELVRQRQEICVQSTPRLTDSSTQSFWSRKVNSSAQTEYVTMLPELAKTIQEQDDFPDFARKIQERVAPILDANHASDVFKDQLALLVASDDSLVKSFSVSQLKEYLSLKDARFNAPICCIDWQPGRTDTVAISFASTSTFDRYLDVWVDAPVEHVFLWSFQAILHPSHVLESPSVVKVFRFCPTNPNLIACGCEDGQVLMYDLSDEQTRVNAVLRKRYSSEDSSSVAFHAKYSSMILSPTLAPTKCPSQPICDLAWLPPQQKINRIGELDICEVTSQFVTVSLDGRLIVWDTTIDANNVHANTDALLPGASLTNEWTPVFTMNIYKNAKSLLYFPTRLFHVVADAGKLNGEARIVTEEGEVLGFNWISGGDRSLTGRQNPTIALRQQFLYHTPVSFVPSPFIPGLFLACDRAQIVLADLSQGLQELFRSSARTSGLTCVVFSPTRPSLFLAGKDNGEVEIWAVLDKSHECLFTQSVASSRVVSLSFGVGHNEKQLLAVGCGDGSLMIYKVPDFMSKPGHDEGEQMKKFVEQQRAFVLQTEDRFKVRAAEARQKEADARNTKKADSEEKAQEEEDFDEDKVDIELVQFEREYTRILKEFEAIEAKNAD
jgi:WD40 repeat protein